MVLLRFNTNAALLGKTRLAKPAGSPVSSISGMTSGLGQFVLSPLQ